MSPENGRVVALSSPSPPPQVGPASRRETSTRTGPAHTRRISPQAPRRVRPATRSPRERRTGSRRLELCVWRERSAAPVAVGETTTAVAMSVASSARAPSAASSARGFHIEHTRLRTSLASASTPAPPSTPRSRRGAQSRQSRLGHQHRIAVLFQLLDIHRHADQVPKNPDPQSARWNARTRSRVRSALLDRTGVIDIAHR